MPKNKNFTTINGVPAFSEAELRKQGYENPRNNPSWIGNVREQAAIAKERATSGYDKKYGTGQFSDADVVQAIHRTAAQQHVVDTKTNMVLTPDEVTEVFTAAVEPPAQVRE